MISGNWAEMPGKWPTMSETLLVSIGQVSDSIDLIPNIIGSIPDINGLFPDIPGPIPDLIGHVTDIFVHVVFDVRTIARFHWSCS